MHRNPDWKNTGWGSRNGKAVHVSEVSRGLACGCVCPGCGAQLVAKGVRSAPTTLLMLAL